MRSLTTRCPFSSFASFASVPTASAFAALTASITRLSCAPIRARNSPRSTRSENPRAETTTETRSGLSAWYSSTRRAARTSRDSFRRARRRTSRARSERRSACVRVNSAWLRSRSAWTVSCRACSTSIFDCSPPIWALYFCTSAVRTRSRRFLDSTLPRVAPILLRSRSRLCWEAASASDGPPPAIPAVARPAVTSRATPADGRTREGRWGADRGTDVRRYGGPPGRASGATAFAHLAVRGGGPIAGGVRALGAAWRPKTGLAQCRWPPSARKGR